MAHFAKLDENDIVLEVNVVNNDVLNPDDEEKSGVDFLTEWSGGHTNWKQTSYNAYGGGFRKNYAGIGFKYDSDLDAFIAPKPYASWLLNEDSCLWESPKPYPKDGKRYDWNEDLGEWVNA